MKLRFTIEGNDIDLGDAKVSHRLNNPMFEQVGSYSLPFDIPKTLHNISKINRIKASELPTSNKYSSIIYIGPVPIYGSFILSDDNDEYYNGYFTTGNSTFREVVNDVNLNDLDYTEEIAGSSSLSFTDALTAAARSSHPTYNYTCFPMLAPNYYNEDPFSYNSLINPWSYHPTIPANIGFYASSGRSLSLLYAPSFYLCFVIQKIFDLYGFTVSENIFYTDTELRTLVIPNFNTLGEVDTTYMQYDLTFANALPEVSINEFISSLESLFNVTFFISDTTKEVTIKRNTTIIKSLPEKTLKLVSRELSHDEELDGYKLSYTMDPDDDFSKITDISNYTLGLTVDNKSDLELSANAASSYKGQLAKVSNNDLYYLSKLSDASTDTWEWESLTKDYFSKVSESGDHTIESSANPILTDDDYIYCMFTTGLKEYALFPRIDISCINSSGLQEYKTFSSLRLLFYRGVVAGGGNPFNPDDVDSEYPLATPDVYRAKGISTPDRYGREKITSANQSLRWEGTYGLYEKNYKDYLYWYLNLRKSSTDIYEMSLEEILSIEFSKKYQAGEVSVLFRSMNLSLDFSNNIVVLEDCKVYIS